MPARDGYNHHARGCSAWLLIQFLTIVSRVYGRVSAENTLPAGLGVSYEMGSRRPMKFRHRQRSVVLRNSALG